MRYQLITGEGDINRKLGVDLHKVYSRACAGFNPLTYLPSDYVPNFESLYEEYCDMYIQKVTDADSFFESIKEMATSEGGDNVSGSIVGKAEFLNILFMTNHLFFLDGELMNSIVLEVW
jgi:hypothetical protein